MTTDIQAPYRLMLAEQPQQKAELQAYIQHAYQREFDASIPHFLPCLVGLYRADGLLVGACGLQLARDEPLYLEQYLEQPIEDAIARGLGLQTARERIIEVGNFACLTPGNARLMFAALTCLLCDNDLDVVVFTGTAKLRNSFHRLHLEPVELASAEPHRVGEDAQAWGAYYQCQPRVMAGDLSQGRQVLSQNSLLISLLGPMPPLFPCQMRASL
ncbi:MAG: thermostable hemolysin [Aeromonas molluscorum]|jgi:hypothetical protein